ncbi:MAG: carbamoyl phosphate synthase small subunit, partial [Clostridia bacterium]|nr:carbamoyl phosphate synthase small subunit [Clostridia bacterium]
MKKGYLILENGQVFEGVRFGADGTAQGELVFNTSMVGYEGTITDGCNYGKILMHTFPQVGNYGMIGEDVDGPATPCAFVCREYCASPSNFRSEGDLDAYLSEQGVVGLQGVDTRELTRILRDNGSMNAMIADEVPADLTGLKEYKLTGAVAALTYGDVTYEADEPKGKVA